MFFLIAIRHPPPVGFLLLVTERSQRNTENLSQKYSSLLLPLSKHVSVGAIISYSDSNVFGLIMWFFFLKLRTF